MSQHRCETVHDGNLCIYCGDFIPETYDELFPNEAMKKHHGKSLDERHQNAKDRAFKIHQHKSPKKGKK